ncbi:uncharacterized protein LOC132407336 isoform X1 [Hypanus sabinus]|uniref:uncharacterized protein LOC132407336 isoform X1 n=1 Tax=Hypanus sabinus TaxID=79690 RepID=UPI0028C4A722|nr:uncharacterized protein LOC132407336 isoform X1 [Hypanus sabinus]
MVLEVLMGLHFLNWLATLRTMKSNLFFLCLAPMLLRAAAQSCSSYCTCGDDLANCKSVPSLQAVFTDLPSSMAMVLLQGGSITTIEPEAFQNFSKLRYLSVTDFRLSISSYAFAPPVGNQSRLQTLDLSKNSLLSCNIDSLGFAGLLNLMELNLFQNLLDVLNTLWFSELPSLQRLNIQLNKISYLPPRIFQTLSLLNKLNASSNFIQYLSTDTFLGLNALSSLDLSNNRLLFISKDAFKPLQRLNHLFINDNQLVTLAKGPASLQKIQLQGNPWDCSCQLEMLLISLRDAVQDPGSLVCGSPESLKGKLILNPDSSYCSSISPAPETPALHIVPVLNAQAVVYGFIGGILLAGAICLATCLGRRSWRKGTMRSLEIHNSEAKGKLETRESNEALTELDASKLKGVPMITSHQTINVLQNIKDIQVEQRDELLKTSTESWTAMKMENNIEKRKGMRPCKTSPSSLYAANIAHTKNEKTASLNSTVINEGKTGSQESTEREKKSICSAATSSSFHNLQLTKKDELITLRTLRSLNVKTAPNTISASVQDLSSMCKEMSNVAVPHLLPGDTQTHMRLQTSLQSNSKCKLQEKLQDDNVSKEEGTTFQASKSSNEPKIDTLQLLEIDGKLRDKLPDHREILSRNIQNVSNISVQPPTCLTTSYHGLSETSHQQASHHYDQLRLNASQSPSLQHHRESSPFTNQPKPVLDADFNESNTAKVAKNNTSFMFTAYTTPLDEHELTRHHSPCKQKFTINMSEHEFNEIETLCREDSTFSGNNQLLDGNSFELNNNLPKESILLGGSSAGMVYNDIAVSNVLEDKVSQSGSASTSFSRSFAWSVQSQHNWSQSPTMVDSASEHSEINHSQKFTSNISTPKQSSTRITDKENNLDVEKWTNRSVTSFKKRFSRNIASTDGKSNLEPQRYIQCPVIRQSQKLLNKNDVREKMNSDLYKEHFGDTNHSKKMYKSVFKLIDEMQLPPSLAKVQNKALQDEPLFDMEMSRDKSHLHNVLIPLSIAKNIKAVQQFKSSDPAPDLTHLSSLYSRWYYKREFGYKLGKQIQTVGPEGSDLNPIPHFHREKSFSRPADNQTCTEHDIRAWKDFHSPKQFVKLHPPMRKELLADDELTVINLFHNLKQSAFF